MRPTELPRCLPELRRLTIYFLASFLLISAVSCKAAPQSEGQKKFGDDADYFIGLRLLQEGNENAAREKFKYCIKKGSRWCAQRSAEALCTIGNIQEKNAAAENLLKQFPGDEALLIAARQFAASGEVNKLIYYTSDLDFSTAKNELIRMRLEAMGRRGDSAYEEEVYRWFTQCQISTDHYQFYRDFYKHPDFEGAYENPDAELANTMLDGAIRLLRQDEHPIVHSDRGCHYRWPGWIERMNTAGLTRSMSKKGCSPDNSACEGFFGRLKNEMFYGKDWGGVTIEEFIDILNEYIHWYAESRIKLSLGGFSPIQYRKKLGLIVA